MAVEGEYSASFGGSPEHPAWEPTTRRIPVVVLDPVD
jgi:hypothetical protein